MKRQKSKQFEAWKKEHRKKMRIEMADKVMLSIAFICLVLLIALSLPR